MVERHVRARGVRDARVLGALSVVPREAFVPPELMELAYDDSPLPIEEDQTISQPYVVAVMLEALELVDGETVLEVGTGSGYSAAVLAQIAKQVFTIERHARLADHARTRLAALGFANVEVRCADGTLGWSERAPFDAIVVAAAGPDLPRALLAQLRRGGRLVMPVGTGRAQELIRVTRIGETEYRRQDLGAVRFVPLIGAEGYSEGVARTDEPHAELPPGGPLVRAASPSRPALVAKLVAECAEPIAHIDDAQLDRLLDRIGDAHVVLLGAQTHGTSEFNRMRARITQQLILRRGFSAVAIEADWPDAAVVDRYVRNQAPPAARGRPALIPFTRFPAWMWRNEETQELIEWLRAYNAETGRSVRFAGLDMYSMYTSASEVVRYLERVDPATASVARARYSRLAPWQHDPAAYGRAAVAGKLQSSEEGVVAMLRDLLAKRLDLGDAELQFDAAQNARVVADAERYYRAMYYSAVESWNLRDRHMFETLRSLLAHLGDQARVVVWEHNAHVGDATATEMAVRGEHNVGRLCREAFGDVYIIGQATHHGVVTAAHGWEEPMQRMRLRPARADSYERLCHDSGVHAFLLHLRHPAHDALRGELSEPRLERAIGVVYRPESELASHYFQAVLPDQFDELVWFDETDGVHALADGELAIARPPPLTK
ncbi:MAG: protein-L-isoaspartate(D-aspartate) O-methyltransferase [Deltaproteobacteria bacterium]|nr:protein-L-isoaspartate(D-aspartate) O-methyltransferase [Deltaproteobacteria bacterium]